MGIGTIFAMMRYDGTTLLLVIDKALNLQFKLFYLIVYLSKLKIFTYLGHTGHLRITNRYGGAGVRTGATTFSQLTNLLQRFDPF